MSQRLYGLDNLRVFLTMLVIVFHTAIAYGAAGSWYYDDVDKSEVNATIVLLTLFTAVCQAFFMGLFFFLSGYFTPRSYDRKGALTFLIDRLLRLGIPLILYTFWLGPTTIYLSTQFYEQSYPSFFKNQILHFRIVNFGPLWFVEALLYFAVLYSLYRIFAKRRGEAARAPIPFPAGRTLLITAVLSGVVAFLVRFVFPLGTGPLELQLGYFPLYILLFIVGVVTYRNHWLEQIPLRLRRTWLRIALVSILILPLFLILTGALEGELLYSGGMHLQAFLYAMWEPFVCFGICLALLAYFQARWNFTNRFLRALSGSAYTAYILHPLFVVSFTLLFHNAHLAPIIKFVIVAPLSVAACFSVSFVISKLPLARKIV